MGRGGNLRRGVLRKLVGVGVGLALLFLVLAQTEDQWQDPEWLGQQEMSTLVEGAEENPGRLDDPLFFAAFEEKLSEDPEAINGKPKLLNKFGDKIGVTFSEGAGISSYDSNTRTVMTKGCVGIEGDCVPTSVTFSAFEVQPTINPDGSIYIPEGDFEMRGGMLSRNNGGALEVSGEGATIVKNGQEIKSLTGKIVTTKDKGKFLVLGKVEFKNDLGEKFILSGEEYQVGLQGQAKIETEKEVLIRSLENPVAEVVLVSGGAQIESEEKFMFDKDSGFFVTRGVSESSFKVGDETRLCFGECYGVGKILPAEYLEEGVSTIEMLEDFSDKGNDHYRNILKITSIEGSKIKTNLLNPNYNGIFVAVHGDPKRIGQVEVVQRGKYGDGSPFYSQTKMDNIGLTLFYGTNKETEEPYPLDGSPIVYNKISPDNKDNPKQKVLVAYLAGSEKETEIRDLNLASYFLGEEFDDLFGVGAVAHKGPSTNRRLNQEQEDELEESMDLVDQSLDEFPGGEDGEVSEEDLFEMAIAGMKYTSEGKEERLKALEYARSQGEEVDYLEEEFVMDVYRGYIGLEYVEGKDIVPGEDMYFPGDEDLAIINEYMRYTSDEFRDTAALEILEASSSVEDLDEYYKKIEDLEFLPPALKEAIKTGSFESISGAYYTALHSQICGLNGEKCASHLAAQKMFEVKYNAFVNLWGQ